MLFGRTEGITPALRGDLRDAGMLHLTAISGIHVGILVGTRHRRHDGRINRAPLVRLQQPSRSVDNKGVSLHSPQPRCQQHDRLSLLGPPRSS